MVQDGSAQAHSNIASAVTQQPLSVLTLTHIPNDAGIAGGSLLKELLSLHELVSYSTTPKHNESHPSIGTNPTVIQGKLHDEQ